MLSIITITYNAEEFLERTIKSVLKQTNQDFEYLIIDGNSKDGTLEIVEKYKNRVDVLVSEKDNGLYDAMNKGLKRASGKYVWFVNAGDEIAENTAIEKLYEIFEKNPDIVYSDTILVDENGKELGLRTKLTPHKLDKDLNWKNFKRGMLVCHQSFIARKEIAPMYKLDNLSADIDWEINCLKKANTIVRYNGILSKYLLGGISEKQHKKSLKDRYKILKEHFGFLSNLYNHFIIVLRAVFKS